MLYTQPPSDIDSNIFREYDIRGVAGDNLSVETVYWIARAFATQCISQNIHKCAIGGDGRISTPAIRNSLSQGLTEGGLNVVDIGTVPTPLLYYATHRIETGTGIMITGSHNPPEYNGLKMVIGHIALSGESITHLLSNIQKGEFSTGNGSFETQEVINDYISEVCRGIKTSRPRDIVVDCGNGVAGIVAPKLLRQLGHNVVTLYEEVDGQFPNHHPDPADENNLADLKRTVIEEKADVGIAFDGDADRLGVVSNTGKTVWPDSLMMLFSQSLLAQNPGATIVFDVKCSRNLAILIRKAGGNPIMWRTGHSHIKAKIRETQALLGGEFSGHICFADNWYGFDDAVYSAARFLEVLDRTEKSVDEIFANFPKSISTPEIKIMTHDDKKFEIISRLANQRFPSAKVKSIDGIRADYEDGWGLIRASNTSPVLSLRFEADNTKALQRIKNDFRDKLAKTDSTLTFPE